MAYANYVTCSTLTYLFFIGLRGQLWVSACLPPSINTDTDHSQPVPEVDKFDSRPDQAAIEATMADFLKKPRSSGKARI